MKIRQSETRFSACRIFVVMLALCELLAGEPAAMAADPSSAPPAEPIDITADKLVAENSAHTAEFSGNVRAVQGATELLADRLKLFYGEGQGTDTAAATRNIDKIEAYGQVRITFDNKVAVGDQAIYITEERKLILLGPGAKVISGQDEITGSRITFYRNDGRVVLDGDEKSRVKAIIRSDQRGLN